MTLEQIQKKADSFFAFPTANKDHVTTTSAVLFARECVKEAIAGRTYCHSDAQVEADYNKLCDDLRYQDAEICVLKEALNRIVDDNDCTDVLECKFVAEEALKSV